MAKRTLYHFTKNILGLLSESDRLELIEQAHKEAKDYAFMQSSPVSGVTKRGVILQKHLS